MNHRLYKLIAAIAVFFFSHSSMATLLDFTDANLISSLSTITDGYRGSINGIGYTLTSTDGYVNFRENYDGSTSAGCQSNSGPLSCDKDGAGINDDEVTGNSEQTLILSFDSVVSLTGFYFLDLYVNPNGSGAREQATITIDDAFFNTVDATGTPGDGGYMYYAVTPILAQTIKLTADASPEFWDDRNNDYAFAGIDVSAVPVPEPSAFWLLSSILVGLVGIKRLKK